MDSALSQVSTFSSQPESAGGALRRGRSFEEHKKERAAGSMIQVHKPARPAREGCQGSQLRLWTLGSLQRYSWALFSNSYWFVLRLLELVQSAKHIPRTASCASEHAVPGRCCSFELIVKGAGRSRGPRYLDERQLLISRVYQRVAFESLLSHRLRLIKQGQLEKVAPDHHPNRVILLGA